MSNKTTQDRLAKNLLGERGENSSVRIRSFPSPYSVRNVRKYGAEKLRIRTLFM